VYESGISYIIINIYWKQCLKLFLLSVHIVCDCFWTRCQSLRLNSLHISVLNIILIPCLCVVQILVKVLSYFSCVHCLFRKYADCLQPLCRIFNGGLMVGCDLVDSILLLFFVECKWVFVSKTAPWFVDSVHGLFLKMLLYYAYILNVVIERKNASLSTSAVQCYEHFKSDRKLWEGDHLSGCPSALLAKKTCSVPWSIQNVNSMRDGEVRNRSMIVFRRKFVHVLSVQNLIRDLLRILSGCLWCLQETLQNKQ
jgi:hypothetical protein